jgi:transposase-like protein
MTTKKNPDYNRVRMTVANKKKITLDVYNKSLGNISAACREAGISRETFYRWRREDPKFLAATDEVNESSIDFAESMLLKNIKEGKETSLIFYLKTKGKSRGYVETVDNNVTINPFLDLMKAATSEDE